MILTHYLPLLRRSPSLKLGIFISFLFFALTGYYVYINWDKDWLEILMEVRDLCTFLMVGWSVIRFFFNREKVEITLTEGRFRNDNQTIKVSRKQLRNISDITNIVSAKFYGGEKIDGAVRNQLFVFAELITEEEMRRLNG